MAKNVQVRAVLLPLDLVEEIDTARLLGAAARHGCGASRGASSDTVRERGGAMSVVRTGAEQPGCGGVTFQACRRHRATTAVAPRDG